jgi:hypothetical protein
MNAVTAGCGESSARPATVLPRSHFFESRFQRDFSHFTREAERWRLRALIGWLHLQLTGGWGPCRSGAARLVGALHHSEAMSRCAA